MAVSISHGTAGGYSNHGCRCAECTAAHRARMREYYRKRRNAMPSDANAKTPGTTEKWPRDVDAPGAVDPREASP